MHPSVETKVEHRRGCGYRSPGGLYLMSGGTSCPCGKLPIPLNVCPTCGNGIKPSRGWTWVEAAKLTEKQSCYGDDCSDCPLYSPQGFVGLLWIGEKFYKTPSEFCDEAIRMGVSRRISAVPNDFKVGETWVWLAHRKCIPVDDILCPGVFQIFKPTHIEYVVKGDESNKEIEKLLKRGITPVKVERAGETKQIFQAEEEN